MSTWVYSIGNVANILQIKFFQYWLKIVHCKLWNFFFKLFCFGIEFRFGSGSVKNAYFGFGPVSVKFHSGRSLMYTIVDIWKFWYPNVPIHLKLSIKNICTFSETFHTESKKHLKIVSLGTVKRSIKNYLRGQYWNLFLAPGSCHGDSGGPVFQPALQSNGSSVVYVVLGQWF